MGKITLWFGILVLLFGAIAAFELKHFEITDTSNLPEQQLAHISVGNVPLYITVADTPQKQQQGLSGTDSLPQDQGMLFVFPQDGSYAFWMKDMNYSLDILWLDTAGKIVYMKENLSPDTYPITYQSPVPARYVLEVNAGFVDANNISVGDIVHFH